MVDVPADEHFHHVRDHMQPFAEQVVAVVLRAVNPTYGEQDAGRLDQRERQDSHAEYRQTSLEGKLMGDIPAAGDVRRYPHRLQLDLALRGERLGGAVIAGPLSERASGHRSALALSHWLELV